MKDGVKYYLRNNYKLLPPRHLQFNQVAERVRMGGHNVLEEIIRRRYRAGLYNFFALWHNLKKRYGKTKKICNYSANFGKVPIKSILNA